MNNTLKHVGFMIAATIFFSVMSILIRYASADMHSAQIVFLRNLFSIPIVLPFLIKGGLRKNLTTNRFKEHFLRSATGLIGMLGWFYCLTAMPLNQATALSLSAPIFAAIIAMLFLDEKAGIRRWIAVGFALVGALIIIRPDTNGLNINALIMLGSTLMWATAGVMVKSLSTTEKVGTIVFYTTVFMSIFSLPPALLYWKTPSTDTLTILVGIAAVAACAQFCITKAFSGADMATLAPFDFFRLIFTAILASLFFGETSQAGTWIGAAIVVASAAYITHREALAKKKAQQT